MIYQHTCPHRAVCSAVFDQNWNDPLYSPSLTLSNIFFFVSLDENVLHGKCFADVEEVKQKTAEALKGIKIDKFKNWAVEKTSR